jgi:hypothetical protein
VQHLVAGKHLYLGMTRESAGEVLLPHLERAAGRLRPQLTSMKADADAVAPLAVVPAPSSGPSKDTADPRRRGSAVASSKRRSPTDSP